MKSNDKSSKITVLAMYKKGLVFIHRNSDK